MYNLISYHVKFFLAESTFQLKICIFNNAENMIEIIDSVI